MGLLHVLLILLLLLLFPVPPVLAAPEEKPPTEKAPVSHPDTKPAETPGEEARPDTEPELIPLPVFTGVFLPALQSVPGVRSPVSRNPDAGEWFLELRYRVNDTELAGNVARSFLHGGTNHHSEVTLLRKVPILGFGEIEAMGLFRYTDDPRVDPEVNSLQRGYLRFTGPGFEVNFGDYLTNYSRFSFNQNTKGLNIWKQTGSFKFTGTAGVFVDRWGSIFKKFNKFTDPTLTPDPRFPSKPFTRLVLGFRAEQRIDENSFVGLNLVQGRDLRGSLPREAEVRPVVNNVLSLDTSIRVGRDFTVAGEVALSFSQFDSRLQPGGTGSNAARFEMSHRAGRASWRVDYALFRPNFFSVNARQVQDLQDFSARGSVDLGANTVLNLSFRHTNDNLPGLPVVVTPEGFIEPVVLTNPVRTRVGAAGLERFNRIVDENLNPLTTTVQTPEARLTFRRLPPGRTMQVNFGYRERRFRTNNEGSFSPTTGGPLFRERITRIPFLDLEWSMQSTQLGLSYEYRQNRDRVTALNSTFTNRFVGNYRGTYFLGNWIVSPMFRFETEPEGKNLECQDADRQEIAGNNSLCFLTTALDFPGRDQTRSYQGSLEVDFPKYFLLELLYRELNAQLLTTFTQDDVTDLNGDVVTVRFLGNGGYRRPYGRAALTLKIKNSEDHTLVVSFERGVNTFLNPDPTVSDERSFRENVMQLEYVIRWRR